MRQLAFEKMTGPQRKSALAAEQIVSAIKAGTLHPGDKLPSERELSELMGISRNSIREAITALSVAGVVETRVGDGTYIIPVQKQEVLGAVTSLRTLGIDISDIWKAKQEIETMLLTEAIERVTDDDVETLEIITEHMADAIHHGAYQGYSLSNIAFHLRIAEIADKPALKRAENHLLRITQQIYKPADAVTPSFLHDHLYKSYLTHMQILKVLRDHKKEEASMVMRSHFDEVQRYLQHVYPEGNSIIPDSSTRSCTTEAPRRS